MTQQIIIKDKKWFIFNYRMSTILPEISRSKKKNIKIPQKNSFLAQKPSMSKPPKRNKSQAPQIDSKKRKSSIASSSN